MFEINDDNFKTKVVNELNDLIEKKKLIWKELNEDGNDFMTSVRYSNNNSQSGISIISFGYRVCCFGGRPRIIVYDYAYKNGPTETLDLPSFEIFDKTTKNSKIYELMLKIKNKVDEEKKLKDEKLLDKFTWYINNKKRIEEKDSRRDVKKRK